MENELELETTFETESDLHNGPVSMKLELKFTLWLKITSNLDTQPIFILAVLHVIYCLKCWKTIFGRFLSSMGVFAFWPVVFVFVLVVH